MLKICRLQPEFLIIKFAWIISVRGSFSFPLHQIIIFENFNVRFANNGLCLALISNISSKMWKNLQKSCFYRFENSIWMKFWQFVCVCVRGGGRRGKENYNNDHGHRDMIMLFFMTAMPWSYYIPLWPCHDLAMIMQWRVWITMIIPCHGMIVMFSHGCQPGLCIMKTHCAPPFYRDIDL